MSDTDQLVIAWAPFAYINRALAAIVISSAGAIDQANLDAISSDSFDVFDQRRTFFCCLDELFTELSSKISHAATFNIKRVGCVLANINSILILHPAEVAKTLSRAMMTASVQLPGG